MSLQEFIIKTYEVASTVILLCLCSIVKVDILNNLATTRISQLLRTTVSFVDHGSAPISDRDSLSALVYSSGP